MGSAFTDWAQAEGPIYMGANSSWEVIWFAVAAALCVISLVSGAKHEHDTYRRLKQGKKVDTGPG